MAHIKGDYDVQVDGNHQYEEGITEIDVYPVEINSDGIRHTDTLTTLASVHIPSEGYSDDRWYDFPQEWDDLRALPENIRKGVEDALAKALAVHNAIERTQKYNVGDTVFLTEHRFPGDVTRHTVNGGYIIEMANSGELGEFSESELEDYDQERWHRP